MTWDPEVTGLYLTEEVGDTGVIKGKGATQQGIQDDSTGPHVNLRTCIQLGGEGQEGEGQEGEGQEGEG